MAPTPPPRIATRILPFPMLPSRLKPAWVETIDGFILGDQTEYKLYFASMARNKSKKSELWSPKMPSCDGDIISVKVLEMVRCPQRNAAGEFAKPSRFEQRNREKMVLG